MDGWPWLVTQLEMLVVAPFFLGAIAYRLFMGPTAPQLEAAPDQARLDSAIEEANERVALTTSKLEDAEARTLQLQLEADEARREAARNADAAAEWQAATQRIAELEDALSRARDTPTVGAEDDEEPAYPSIFANEPAETTMDVSDALAAASSDPIVSAADLDPYEIDDDEPTAPHPMTAVRAATPSGELVEALAALELELTAARTEASSAVLERDNARARLAALEAKMFALETEAETARDEAKDLRRRLASLA